MDTSHWKTNPVGRYLIDLPPNAQFYWHPLRYKRKYKLEWKKDLTIEEANALLEKEAERLKQIPHKKSNGTRLVRFGRGFGARSLGSALTSYPYDFADDSFVHQCYFSNLPLKDTSYPLENRVFYYEEEVINVPIHLRNAAKFINHMSNHICPIYPIGVIYSIPGAHFDGGLLVGPDKGIPWGREEIGIEATFPEYPGIEFTLFIDHLLMDTGNGKSNTTIAGNPAQEGRHVFTKNNITHYAFHLSAPSKEDRWDVPSISMRLRNPTGGIMRDGVSTRKPPIKRPSFKSKEEALTVWNRIKESVRWRPDGWMVPSPGSPYFLVNGKMVPYIIPNNEQDSD